MGTGTVRVERVLQPELEQRRRRGDLGVNRREMACQGDLNVVHQAVPEVCLVPDGSEAVGVRIERIIGKRTDSRMPFL